MSFDELVHDVMDQDGGSQQFDSSEFVHGYAGSSPDGEGILHLCCMGLKLRTLSSFSARNRAGRCFPITRSHRVDDFDGRHVLEG